MISCQQFEGAEIANLNGVWSGRRRRNCRLCGLGYKWNRKWNWNWYKSPETGHKSCVLVGVAIELVWASTGTNDDHCCCLRAVVISGAFNPSRLETMVEPRDPGDWGYQIRTLRGFTFVAAWPWKCCMPRSKMEFNFRFPNCVIHSTNYVCPCLVISQPAAHFYRQPNQNRNPKTRLASVSIKSQRKTGKLTIRRQGKWKLCRRLLSLSAQKEALIISKSQQIAGAKKVKQILCISIGEASQFSDLATGESKICAKLNQKTTRPTKGHQCTARQLG